MSKRKFKKAVDRNLIRRRMKESFRLLWQSHLNDSMETHLHIMMIYSANEILPYSVINEGISKGLIQIKKSL
ncbi:MAG: ribonuclease P protein component [Saprospiraceae bacterium]|nr:ribonuclease P protein component [Saprospiraceae bacterium]